MNKNKGNPFADDKEGRTTFGTKSSTGNFGNNYLQMSTRAFTKSARTSCGYRRGSNRQEYQVMDAKTQEEELEELEKELHRLYPIVECRELKFENLDEVILAEQYQKLPEIQKFTKGVISKCRRVKRFDIIPDEVILNVFHDEPDQFVETKDVVIYLSGDNPSEFYLQLFRDMDRHYLMSKYLEDGVRQKKLGIPEEKSIKVGDVFSTFSNVNGKWYRGRILEICEQSYFKISYIDYGIIDLAVHFERLRVCPKIVWNVQPLCIRCKLYNVEPPNKIGFDSLVRHEFVETISGDEFFKMTIISEDDDGLKSVVLRRKTNEGIKEVNEQFRNYIGEIKQRLRLENEQYERFPTCTELPYLLHMNAEVDVKVFSQIENKGLRNFKVTSVENPGSFYVELLIYENKDPRVGWYSLFQDFYNNVKNRTIYEVRTPRIYKFRCYVFINPKTRYWERIRVREANNLEKMATVLLVDIGEIQMVEYKSIFELSPAFARYSSLAFKAHLVDICPPNGEVEWSQESIDTFKALTLSTDEIERSFHGIIMKRVDCVEPGSNIISLEIGLILVEKDESVTWTVSAEMVCARVAAATGFSAGRQDLEGDYDKIVKFDSSQAEISFQEEFGDLLEDNQNEEENGDEGDGDNAKSKSKYSAEIERIKNIVQITNSNREQMQCNSKDKEKEEESKRETGHFKSWLTAQTQKEPTNREHEHIPDFLRERVGLASVINVLSPGCFYINLDSKRKDLEKMEKMLEMVEILPELEYDYFKEGMLVAVLITDQKNGIKIRWQRAILKRGFPSLKSFRCFLVDYTTEINVRSILIRPLPEYFRHISSYATRVHIEATDIMPAGGKAWTSDSSQTFRKYVLTWEAEQPVYFAWRPIESEFIGLEEIHQEVEYDRTIKGWKASRPKLQPLDESINAYKDEQILENIFKSIGVDLSYEIFTKEHEFYNTAPLTDMLVKRGYIVKAQKEIGRVPI